jgi:hypothetical protein
MPLQAIRTIQAQRVFRSVRETHQKAVAIRPFGRHQANVLNGLQIRGKSKSVQKDKDTEQC